MLPPWPAPAKLNLLLRITGRRGDGYHLLQTVFQFLDYGDYLHLTVREDGDIVRLTNLPGVAPEQDLVVKAARLLQRYSGTRYGVSLAVDKRLPLGGGLGGGSSNAATVLVALNRLWGLGLTEEALAQLGLGLGADVPVFVRGQAAWGEGVGEVLTPLTLSESWFLVVVPDCLVSTAAVFNDPELTRHSPPITIDDFLAGAIGNDCEAIVRRRYPPVDQALGWLEKRGVARLTGTGACVFAAFPNEETPQTLLSQLPTGWRGFVARGRNRSPLLDRLAQASERVSQ